MKVRFDANGDVIVVTGGANGIGRALAIAAAKAGAKVAVCDVDRGSGRNGPALRRQATKRSNSPAASYFRRREQDLVVAAPRAACGDDRIRQRLGRSALERDLLERAACKKSKRSAISRPEQPGRAANVRSSAANTCDNSAVAIAIAIAAAGIAARNGCFAASFAGSVTAGLSLRSGVVVRRSAFGIGLVIRCVAVSCRCWIVVASAQEGSPESR